MLLYDGKNLAPTGAKPKGRVLKFGELLEP